MRARAALLALVCLVVAACGARVSESQIVSSGEGGTVGGPASSQESLGESAVTGAGDAVSSSGESGSSGATGPGEQAAQVPAGTELTASDVGITPETITIGQVTQVSGPVPGLFEGSVHGINAWVAYQNSIGGLAGRKVRVDVRDDGFDAGQHRAHTADLVTKAFALVGGSSLYDDAGVPPINESGAPDIPGLTLTQTRSQAKTNFAPVPNVDGASSGQWHWFKRQFPEAVKAVGSVYGDVPAAKRSHENFRRGAEAQGYVWKYDRGYQPTETDFTADIIRMRQSGVRAVFLVALDAKNVARVMRAAQQQNWKPDVWMLGASAYDRTLLTLAGPAAEGAHVFVQYALYAGEDGGNVPEVKLFNEWFQKVKPGATPTLYAVAAWISGRLFAQAVEQAGPNPTREAVVAALRKVTAYSGNGLMAETNPAGKQPSNCYAITTIKDGKYVRVEPADKGFLCEGTYFRRS